MGSLPALATTVHTCLSLLSEGHSLFHAFSVTQCCTFSCGGRGNESEHWASFANYRAGVGVPRVLAKKCNTTNHSTTSCRITD